MRIPASLKKLNIAMMLHLVQCFSPSLFANSTTENVLPPTTTTSPAPTPSATLCNQLDASSAPQKACFEFMERYSSHEYRDILTLPNRVQTVDNHDDLVKCLDGLGGVCDNSTSSHYLILINTHALNLSEQVESQLQHRSVALKGVYPGTTIQLEQSGGGGNADSEALLKLSLSEQLIVDGIHWHLRDPARSANLDDEQSEPTERAVFIEDPAGPVVIRDNTFRYTGHQVRPRGYVYVQSPNPSQTARGLVDICGNTVDSSNLFGAPGYYDALELLQVECRDEDRVSPHPRRCDRADIKIRSNVFRGNPVEMGSGSGNFTANATISGDGDGYNASDVQLITRSAITVRNIDRFIIEHNRQIQGSALADILVDYSNQQAIHVCGDLRNNIGHSSPEADFEPTIILMNTDARQPTTGNIHLSNNVRYELDNQLSLTELAVHQSSVMTSSQTIASFSPSLMPGSTEESDDEEGLSTSQVAGFIAGTVVAAALLVGVITLAIVIHVVGKKEKSGQATN